jgi:hypothetical protein
LADPRWAQYLKNPNDRAAAGNLWGLMYGGPESAANMGNSLFTQNIGAIQGQELAAAQNKYQQQQQAQAHQFRLAEQTHGTDEALRLEALKQQQQLDTMKQGYDFVSKPLPDGWTAEQKQYAANQAATIAGYKLKEGYDVVTGPQGGIVGQIPQRGTPERSKIEATGHAYSNVSDLAAKHLWQLQNNRFDRQEWNTETLATMNDLRKIHEAGAMTDGDIAHYEKLLPTLMFTEGTALTADVLGAKRDQLRALKEKMDRDLNQYAQSTLIPVGTYTADDWRAPVSDRSALRGAIDAIKATRAANEQRIKDLGATAPGISRSEFERGGPLPAYNPPPSSRFTEEEFKKLSGREFERR